MRGFFRNYMYSWITLGFFGVSFGLHWWFGWLAYLKDTVGHGATPEVRDYLVLMARDTFENWQSEFLQLGWQVAGLAWFLHRGSPASKDADDEVKQNLRRVLHICERKLMTEDDDIREYDERNSDGH